MGREEWEGEGTDGTRGMERKGKKGEFDIIVQGPEFLVTPLVYLGRL